MLERHLRKRAHAVGVIESAGVFTPGHVADNLHATAQDVAELIEAAEEAVKRSWPWQRRKLRRLEAAIRLARWGQK